MQFSWVSHPSRIRAQILTMPKYAGGMGFPDPVRYYQAAHLLRTLDWGNHGRVKSWVSWEQHISSIPLKAIPWLNTLCPAQVREHPILGAMFK